MGPIDAPALNTARGDRRYRGLHGFRDVRSGVAANSTAPAIFVKVG